VLTGVSSNGAREGGAGIALPETGCASCGVPHIKAKAARLIMAGLSSAEKPIHPAYGQAVRRARIMFIALAGIVLLVLSTVTGAGGDAGGREVLKGIKSIRLEVEDLPRMAETLGIKKESLRQDVAARLRQAGIEVVSDDALQATPSLPFLKISLIIGYSKPAYIYAVVVGLNEKVSLERDPRIISYAMPWWRIVKGEQSGERVVAGFVQETLQYIINEFIADYTAANADTHTNEGGNGRVRSPGNAGCSGKKNRG